MPKLSDATVPTISHLATKIEDAIAGCDCLADAAQEYTNVFYEEFRESIVLVRLFATVPFAELPAPNQTFVTALAASAGPAAAVNGQTLVLSLLGTRGEKPAWNDRRHSRGHVGIPLASGEFIDAIPMMSRLLKELGLSLDWINSRDSTIVAKVLGRTAGVFYVPEARTAVDHKGRKTITAQDFVAAYNVKTVFGLGGGYLTSHGFVTSIIFLRETIEKRQAERFTPLINTFKSHTVTLASRKKVFGDH
jgi:hypothetical protein